MRNSGKQRGARASTPLIAVVHPIARTDADGTAEGVADDERSIDAKRHPSGRDHLGLRVGRSFIVGGSARCRHGPGRSNATTS